MRKLLLASLLSLGLAAPAFSETIHIGVDRLVCAFCVKGIENSFEKQEAVDKIKVDLDEKLVTVTTTGEATLDDATIKKLITDAGYITTSIHRQK